MRRIKIGAFHFTDDYRRQTQQMSITRRLKKAVCVCACILTRLCLSVRSYGYCGMGDVDMDMELMSNVDLPHIDDVNLEAGFLDLMQAYTKQV